MTDADIPALHYQAAKVTGCMAANDAWQLQGMNGAVPVGSGETFTGLSRGVFLFATGSVALTMLNPRGTTDSVTVGPTVDSYVPGPFTVVAVTGSAAIVYPESLDYTVA